MTESIELRTRAEKKPKIPPLDNARIRDIAEAVYRDLLGESAVAKMIADGTISGEKLRERAVIYEPLVVPFCRALGVEVPRMPGEPLPTAAEVRGILKGY